jgi:hypothetical protein
MIEKTPQAPRASQASQASQASNTTASTKGSSSDLKVNGSSLSRTSQARTPSSSPRQDVAKNATELTKDVAHIMLDKGGPEADKAHRRVFSHSTKVICSHLSGQKAPAGLQKKFGALHAKTQDIEDIELAFKGGKTKGTDARIRYCNKVSEETRGLKAGESLFLPAGTLAHAMLYRVTKQDNGEIQLDIINTGDGLDNHHADKNGKHSPVVTIRDIKQGSFEDKFHDLMDTLTRDAKKTTDDIYTTARSMGTEEIPPNIPPEAYIKGQAGDTCTHKCCTALLKLEYTQKAKDPKVGLQKYEALRTTIKHETLTQLWENSSSFKTAQAPIDYETLISLACKSFDHSLGKAEGNPFLDKGMKTLINDIKNGDEYDKNIELPTRQSPTTITTRSGEDIPFSRATLAPGLFLLSGVDSGRLYIQNIPQQKGRRNAQAPQKGLQYYRNFFDGILVSKLTHSEKEITGKAQNILKTAEETGKVSKNAFKELQKHYALMNAIKKDARKS